MINAMWGLHTRSVINTEQMATKTILLSSYAVVRLCLGCFVNYSLFAEKVNKKIDEV